MKNIFCEPLIKVDNCVGTRNLLTKPYKNIDDHGHQQVKPKCSV